MTGSGYVNKSAEETAAWEIERRRRRRRRGEIRVKAIADERARCLALVKNIGVYLPDETEMCDVGDVIKAIELGLTVDQMEARMMTLEGW